MAKYCYECWNEIHGKNVDEYDFLYKIGVGVCKNCGRYENLVIMPHNKLTKAYEFLYGIYYNYPYERDSRKRRKNMLKKK